ncbi:sn-glycerol-3-phosphate import ATP-binding protein UgpC [bacterium HR21]|jgi:ABC-type sugar transport system ATPase subunit|nr:sn-glycerol-3-phosphate import ATP-binding protein UgpC [bacterium HR21]
MTRLRLQQLTKLYGTTPAVQELSLTVEPGEFLTVVGPSGSGKSTLLRLIAGLEMPSTGEIFFDDQPVTHLPPQARDVGMVFQNYALYPHMTVFENLAFPLRLRKWKREAIRERVHSVARLLGVEDLLARRPGELSGGQRQRVALGRALVRSPRLFLFDEPLSNVDAQLRAAMRAELATLQRTLGITALYVTHDQTEALSLGDRVAVLIAGQLLQLAPAAELYTKPVSVTVARFIGTPPMNLLTATVRHGKLSIGSAAIPLPDSLWLPEDSHWLLGVRAEALTLSASESMHPLGEVRVRAREYAGHEVLLALEHPATACSPLMLRVAAGQPCPQPGDVIPLFLPPQGWCLFEPESGARIFPP